MVTWPIYSLRRLGLCLLGTVLGIFLLVTACSHVSGQKPPQRDAAGAPASSSVPAPTRQPTSAPVSRSSAPPVTVTSSSAPEPAPTTTESARVKPYAGHPLKVATEFGKDWVAKTSAKRWHAALQKLSTPEYGHDVLPTIPGPKAVTATEISGTSKIVAHGQDWRTVKVKVPMDRQSIVVTLVDQTGKGDWLAAQVSPTG
jgi:hypothetical protein